MSDEERRIREEKEKKKAEVRKRLEEASKAKKAKKGFMTPERKKKLRTLLRKKAAEELKAEQERKAAARKTAITERCGQPKNLDGANEATLLKICKEYYTRLVSLEEAKFDLELDVRFKDYQINELNIQVNDLRGKFVKPTLKKVSKFDQKFSKLSKATKALDVNFRTNLKSVATTKFKLDEDDKEQAKPEWSLASRAGGKTEGGEGGAEE